MPKLKPHSQSAPRSSTQGNHERLIHEEALTQIASIYSHSSASSSRPDAVQAVVDCTQVYRWRVFQASLAATSIETRGRLLAALVSGLPQGLQEEFRGLKGEAIALLRMMPLAQ